jgi:hypothetical protein
MGRRRSISGPEGTPTRAKASEGERAALLDQLRIVLLEHGITAHAGRKPNQPLIPLPDGPEEIGAGPRPHMCVFMADVRVE